MDNQNTASAIKDASASDPSRTPAAPANPLEPVQPTDVALNPNKTPDTIESLEPGEPGAALPEISIGTVEVIPVAAEEPDAQGQQGHPDLPPATDGENSPARPVVVNVPPATCSSEPGNVEENMLKLINEARAEPRACGDVDYIATRPLSWNSTLENAARTHSADMASVNYFSHTGSDGSSAATRVTGAGYAWRTVGENIAAGRNSAAQTLVDWLESPGHCRNIMNPAFREVAVACVEDSGSDYRYYWTNILAAPR